MEYKELLCRYEMALQAILEVEARYSPAQGQTAMVRIAKKALNKGA